MFQKYLQSRQQYLKSAIHWHFSENLDLTFYAIVMKIYFIKRRFYVKTSRILNVAFIIPQLDGFFDNKKGIWVGIIAPYIEYSRKFVKKRGGDLECQISIENSREWEILINLPKFNFDASIFFW